ncbi:MAG TPA: PadR family transcriptional regulator [Anaerolineaceae bacterium]|nr:PadR family transcriptional regulator [Anaerolineaceae bacterium]
MIRFILLGFLNYQPMTGYNLKQAIDSSTAHFWHAYHSQIYTTLRQMEADGLVVSRFVQEESQPDRRVYTITPAGKQALKEWLDHPLREVSPIKEELLVRIFFSAQRDPQEVLAELILQRELHREKAAAYQVIAAHMSEYSHQGEANLERDEAFWRLTLKMGIRYEEAYLAWLEEAIQTVQEL